jgi:hypothetical protein
MLQIIGRLRRELDFREHRPTKSIFRVSDRPRVGRVALRRYAGSISIAGNFRTPLVSKAAMVRTICVCILAGLLGAT